jgi:phosphomevalonate kinase
VITTTAPGKLFLTGEWAVLRGAPAVVAAVDRVVRVTFEVEPGDGPLTIESVAENRRWRGLASVSELPEGDAGAVVAALRRVGPAEGHVTVDSRAFLIGERKLGLGRSAATIAAAVAARRLLDRASVAPDAVLPDALVANALFQTGVGSGADVAASVYGGLVTAERSDDGLAVTRRRLPEGASLIAGWTGESAATTPLVSRFAAMPSPPVFVELAATARAAANAVRAGDLAAFTETVDRSADLLARFGEETGLPVVTPALRRLVETARRAGAVAKPSGAGGGDCGIALAPSPSVAAVVRAAWRDAGILPLDVTIAADGVARG